MLEKPVIVLTQLLHWLAIANDGPIVERAVSNMRFCNLQAREKQENKTLYPADENALFFRRGRSGSGRSELQESTLREIQERTAPLLNEANQRLIKQALEFPPPPAKVENQPDSKAPHQNGHAMLNVEPRKSEIPTLLPGT